MKQMRNASISSPPLVVPAQVYLRWWSQVSAALLVVVELCWILPWFKMVTQITTTASLAVTGVVLGGIMLAAYGLGVAMEEMRLLKNVQLAGMGLFLVGSLVLAENVLLDRPFSGVMSGLALLDPGAVLILFFVIWMWWRGISLSRGAIHPIIAWRRFELGLLFFIAFVFIASRAGFGVPGLFVFFLFLFAGLLAVIFARVSYVGLAKGMHKNPFDLRWSLSVVGVLGATVLLATIAGGLLSGQQGLLFNALGEALKFMIAVAIFVLSIPGLLVSYFFVPIIPWLKSLVSRPGEAVLPEYPIENLAQAFDPQRQVVNLPLVLQTILFWGIILLLVVVLIMRVRKSMAGKRRDEAQEPESLLHEGEARKLLQKALQDALEGLAGRLRPVRKAIIAARIRRIYAQMLELCAALGRPRLPQQTPLEFLPEMGEIFTDQVEALNTITTAYVRVRYGELPETDEEIDQIEQAWQEIEAKGRQLKRAGVGRLKTADVKEWERSGT